VLLSVCTRQLLAVCTRMHPDHTRTCLCSCPLRQALLHPALARPELSPPGPTWPEHAL